MKKLLLLVLLLALMVAIQRPMVESMATKAATERVGFIANPYVMRFMAVDHKETVAAMLALKSLLYYGQIVELQRTKAVTADFSGLNQLLTTAVRLDPYNTDLYYFPQAILAWDLHYTKRVVQLLDYGMGYRTWDYMLPFWAGFDSAHFLHDYPAAARYYKKAGDISQADVFKRLTARYLFQADQTSFAIVYLRTMIKSATSSAMRNAYKTRLVALEGGQKIEQAVQRYKKREGVLPVAVETLLHSGDLAELPVEPFGGVYHLDTNGRVYSTSQFMNRIK